jgi:hypothetical protein
MKTRSASRLMRAVLCVVMLSSACVAAPCPTDTLTNYINKVQICTINNRTFSKFKKILTVSIDTDDITVTPIKTADYVGLEFTGFGEATQPNYGLQVSYLVCALDDNLKASTPMTELIVNLDDINVVAGTSAFAGLAYTIALDSDAVSIGAATPLPKRKRSAAEFDKALVIEVTNSSMGATSLMQGKQATFKRVRNRFYPAK